MEDASSRLADKSRAETNFEFLDCYVVRVSKSGITQVVMTGKSKKKIKENEGYNSGGVIIPFMV